MEIRVQGLLLTKGLLGCKPTACQSHSLPRKLLPKSFDVDFYLQAHAGIQGSVKATHYIVVYDENGLTSDDIQQGTHSASYLYARATKAVSLIPAAYYTDLACEPCRCYLNDFLVDHKLSSARKSPEEKKKEADRVFGLAKKAWGQGVSAWLPGKSEYLNLFC